jgi:beta-galactosidase
LGLVIEGKVGAGKIVVCGMDLTRDASDPVSRQLRKSLIDYMTSKKFTPATELTGHEIQSLFAQPNETKLRGVRSIRADSEQGGYGAQEAADGDPNTMWHTSWDDDRAKFPHELVIEFDSPRKLAGFTALPRQDGNHNGWIKDFAVYASNDGQHWGEPLVKSSFADDAKLKTVPFPAPITATWLKLVALSGYAKGPFASLAEFNVFPSSPE